MLKDENVTVQFVPLTKDGCTTTDTDLTEVEKVLKYAVCSESNLKR
jgi:hypothetical protein